MDIFETTLFAVKNHALLDPFFFIFGKLQKSLCGQVFTKKIKGSMASKNKTLPKVRNFERPLRSDRKTCQQKNMPTENMFHTSPFATFMPFHHPRHGVNGAEEQDCTGRPSTVVVAPSPGFSFGANGSRGDCWPNVRKVWLIRISHPQSSV